MSEPVVTEAPLSAEEARQLDIRICERTPLVAEWLDDVMTMQVRHGWPHLGFDSFMDYLNDRVGEHRVRLPRGRRREVVGQMREAGMSTRAIGSALGVSQPTVVEDGKSSGDQNLSPDPEPQPVTGLDGKTYTAQASAERNGREQGEPMPPAQPKKNRRPLPDSFRDAALAAQKDAERLARLTDDDRFTRNAEQVATSHTADLLRTVQTLQEVCDRLTAHNGKDIS